MGWVIIVGSGITITSIGAEVLASQPLPEVLMVAVK
jgi:hypothetical protein